MAGHARSGHRAVTVVDGRQVQVQVHVVREHQFNDLFAAQVGSLSERRDLQVQIGLNMLVVPVQIPNLVVKVHTRLPAILVVTREQQ